MGFVGRELAEEAEKPAINYIRNTGMKYRLGNSCVQRAYVALQVREFCKNSPSELVDQKKKESGNKN